ncbi:cysteine hydrolase [Paenibacillus oenotherae]|uniref:Cysteine hydrolase n=1 Tax=Paenibacillus oenotherae TaxID=1435645 RepID=A0ABS7DCB3_9BACL|nr:isochorismatase family cysteine hydrolase [Paenibacillus oenotherae]MBW7477276.1 cysteine hydrolase [Paenibacillus oenotherae]
MNKLGTGRRHWMVNERLADLTSPALPVRPVTFAAEPQEVTVDLNKSAIIVIDMQNDFCTEGGWLHHIGVDIAPAVRPVERLNRLLPVLRRENVPVLWVNWGNRADHLNISPSLQHVYKSSGVGHGLGDPLPGNGSPVLQKDGWGAALVDVLHAEPTDIRVDKYRMSGFWDTPLDSILRNLGIQTLFFTGVNIDQCVMATLEDAVCLGYDAILLEDCAATTSPAFCLEATLYNTKQCYGFVATSTSVMQGMDRS